VIISTHTASIRAANLLAGFVLLPITSAVSIQFPYIIANRWDVVRLAIATLAVAAVALLRTGVAAFNREEILAREHEQLNLRTIGRAFGTFFREYRPAGTTLDTYRGLPFSARRFYRHELPALLGELRVPLLVAVVAALGGLAAGSFLGQNASPAAMAPLLERVGQAAPPGPGLALHVFLTNLRVSILSNLFSLFSLGIFAFLVPAAAFGQVGFVSNLLAQTGGSWLALGTDSPLQFLVAYILPHGILELPTFIVSAALGIRIGAALLSPPKGFSVGMNMLWALANAAKVWLLLLVPLILLSALVEGFLTPHIVYMLY
jgi:uncharacterized membrane protein SpoIIM required for sporulation